MSLLTVDIGNTSTKLCEFDGEKLVGSRSMSVLDGDVLKSCLEMGHIEGIVYCAVGEENERVKEIIVESGLPYVLLGSDTRLPIRVAYHTRATLGADRLASAVGAVMPGESALVVDAGTAVTADLVVRGEFLGGNISPGISLRFKSLHRFTSRLPLVEAEGRVPEFGCDTETAIRSGVIGGLLGELERCFGEAKKIVKNIKMVLTGGDAPLLMPLLVREGIPVVAEPDALGRGLVRIFNFNI